MDVFGSAALATIIRFIFWTYEKMDRTLGEIARKRRTEREKKGPEDQAKTPRD